MNTVYRLCQSVLIWAVIGLSGVFVLWYQQKDATVATGYTDILLERLPLIILWTLSTLIILLLADYFPLEKDRVAGSLFAQVAISLLIVIGYIAVFDALTVLFSGTWSGARFKGLFPEQFRAYYLPFLGLHWFILGVAWLIEWLRKRHRYKSNEFASSMMITTGKGRVLVEIDKIRSIWGKGAGNRVMVYTARTRHLTRERERSDTGPIVSQKLYRPARRIVMNLAKVKRVERIARNHYSFEYGNNHRIKLDSKTYQQLRRRLPVPVDAPGGTANS